MLEELKTKQCLISPNHSSINIGSSKSMKVSHSRQKRGLARNSRSRRIRGDQTFRHMLISATKKLHMHHVHIPARFSDRDKQKKIFTAFPFVKTIIFTPD